MADAKATPFSACNYEHNGSVVLRDGAEQQYYREQVPKFDDCVAQVSGLHALAPLPTPPVFQSPATDDYVRQLRDKMQLMTYYMDAVVVAQKVALVGATCVKSHAVVIDGEPCYEYLDVFGSDEPVPAETYAARVMALNAQPYTEGRIAAALVAGRLVPSMATASVAVVGNRRSSEASSTPGGESGTEQHSANVNGRQLDLPEELQQHAAAAAAADQQASGDSSESNYPCRQPCCRRGWLSLWANSRLISAMHQERAQPDLTLMGAQPSHQALGAQRPALQSGEAKEGPAVAEGAVDMAADAANEVQGAMAVTTALLQLQKAVVIEAPMSSSQRDRKHNNCRKVRLV
ncbi:hypothetical protein JKP88DRAFT_249278 [Tribonema minus]|uniref:Uncharacterized protein n=1 Tax=Tribonema minus TaxID=303371 RepID=A0A835YK36_9STRA|nr:hypothetical protein JKP88DRAFT_249278 [Tribonema minus]